jgi:hypothetical protein
MQIELPSSETRFAEVQYYFRSLVRGVEKVLAMVSFYSLPHQELLGLSYNMLLSCTHDSEMDLKVIEVQYIRAVVAMVPHQPFPGDLRFFVVEKPGLDIASLGGSTEANLQELLDSDTGQM